MTATLEPVAPRLESAAAGQPGQPGHPGQHRDAGRVGSQGGLVLATLLIVWVPVVLLGGAVQFTVALGLGAVLAVGFIVAHRRRRGRSERLAATRTRGVLHDAAESGAVHGWIEGLTLPQGRAGHLVLNPAGGFVVSSTWHGLGLSDATLRHEATAARATAASTRELLAARGDDTVVRAVVAVWGAASVDLPGGGMECGEVLLVRGEELGGLLAWTTAQTTAQTTPRGALTHARAAGLMLGLSDVPALDSALVLNAA